MALTAVLGVCVLFTPACGGSTDNSFFDPASDQAGAPGSTEPGGGQGGEAPSGEAGSGSLDNGAALFDPAHVLDVAITLEPADWDVIRNQTRSLDTLFGGDCMAGPFESPFSYVHANITVDGQERADVGLRKKGFLGSLDADKPSLKISLNEFVDQELEGTHDITLNNAKQDPTYLNQCVAYALFARAGVPAPRCNFAHVTVSGKDLGVYVHVEAIKKPMLRRFFSSDEGNLYEGTLSDFREGWTATFDKKTNESDPSRPEIDALTQAAAASDAELLASLEPLLDLDAFFSLWATEVLVEHWDGYASNTNNYYAYADPDSGKLVLLPWGADQLFGGTDSGVRKPQAGVLTTGVLANRLYGTVEGRRRFDARLRELLDGVWSEDAVLGELERMDRMIAPFLPATALATHAASLASLKTRVDERRAFLELTLLAPRKAPGKLRGSVCLEDIGSISGTFATTWGTTGALDPFASGSGTLSITVGDTAWQLVPNYVGAVAGPSDDPTSELSASIGVPALRSDDMLALLYLGVKAEHMKPGDVALDLSNATGLLLEADPSVLDGPATVIGTIFGSLHLDAASTVAGAPVSGRFDGKLYSSGLLGGN